jgi:hypothetical protein
LDRITNNTILIAALGPLARQKNGIITPAPLLDTSTVTGSNDIVPLSFKQKQGGYSSVIIGGHSPNCRWYSEDALTLADNIKVMIIHKFSSWTKKLKLFNNLAYGE